MRSPVLSIFLAFVLIGTIIYEARDIRNSVNQLKDSADGKNKAAPKPVAEPANL